MSFDQKTIDQLVTCRVLLLFLYNFRSADIDELCQNQNFKYTWDKLSNRSAKSRKKNLGMMVIDFKDFYDAFSTDMSFKTQALVLKKAMSLYENEARKQVEFTMSIPNHD